MWEQGTVQAEDIPTVNWNGAPGLVFCNLMFPCTHVERGNEVFRMPESRPILFQLELEGHGTDQYL